MGALKLFGDRLADREHGARSIDTDEGGRAVRALFALAAGPAAAGGAYEDGRDGARMAQEAMRHEPTL
jgi:hypothetical protein